MPDPFIPYGRQDVTEADIAAVVDVLRSDFLTQGPAVPAFEAAVAAYCGARHAVAASSATAALHIACRALDLGPGDRLWTVPNTFVASANCALYCGADVDFVDVEAGTWNMDTDALAEKLEAARKAGKLPKVVVPVAFAGLPCDLAGIRALAGTYGFRIIHDASHAIGARYREQPVGRGGWADITIFSFHPVKIITCGEGGMAVTDDPRLAARMARLRSHGITREAAEMTGPSPGPWYYEMVELGWNYRLTDIQAALGKSQLARVDTYVAARRGLAARYDRELARTPLRLPAGAPDGASAWHLYVVGWPENPGAPSRAQAFHALRQAGIGVNVHYIPVHLQPYYRQRGFREGQFPRAEAYYRQAISLPLFPGLSPDQQDWVIGRLIDLATPGA